MCTIGYVNPQPCLYCFRYFCYLVVALPGTREGHLRGTGKLTLGTVKIQGTDTDINLIIYWPKLLASLPSLSSRYIPSLTCCRSSLASPPLSCASSAPSAASLPSTQLLLLLLLQPPPFTSQRILSCSVADPWHFGVWIRIRIMDPSIFVIDLQDANNKKF